MTTIQGALSKWTLLPLLTGIILIGCSAQDDDAVQGWNPGPSVPLLETATQHANEREYRPLHVTENLRIGGEEDALDVYNAVDVLADDEGHIYVLDEGAYQVKQFDIEGALLQSYGEGRGEGPGEFARPVDFAVRENGEVLVLDLVGRSVTLFAEDGSLIGQHPVEGSPVALVASEEEHLVFLTMHNELFHVFDPDGNERHSFGRFMEKQARQSVAVQGTLLWEEDLLYYVGFWSGHLVAATLDGEIRFAARSIDDLDLPGFRHSDIVGTTVLDTDGHPAHPMLALVGDLLYVAVVFPDEERLVLDAYDARSGTYRFSAEWDAPCGPVEMTGEHIYAVCDGAVARFTYTFDDGE